MTLALLGVAAGAVVGYARGGGLARFAALRPQRNRLLLTAIGVHALGVLGGWLWQPLLPSLVAVSWLVLAYYAWVNRAIDGAVLVAAGLLANAVVLLVNGAVPVSTEAAARAGVPPAASSTAGTHAAIGADTRLPWLGDVVPVAFPPRPEVISPGDVAIVAGVAVVVSMGLTGRQVPSRSLGDERNNRAEESGGQSGGDHDHATIEVAVQPQRSAAV